MSSVRRSRTGPVATVAIDRNEAANAIDVRTLQEIVESYEELDADRSVAVVVLRGTGRGFSAGHDMSSGGDIVESLTSRDVLSDWHRLDQANRLLLRLWDGSLPILACVHGYCLGAAVELVMMCDLAIATADCRFSQPALRGTGGVPTELIHPYLIGIRRTKRYLWLSEELSGTEAAEWGIVDKAVPPEALESGVADWAQRISAMPGDNVRLSRRALHRLLDANGFRQALSAGVEMDAIAHASAKTLEWLALVNQVGLKQASKERDAPFLDPGEA